MNITVCKECAPPTRQPGCRCDRYMAQKAKIEKANAERQKAHETGPDTLSKQEA